MTVASGAIMERQASLHNAQLRVPSIHPWGMPIRKVMPAPCTQACPAGINVKAYVSLITEQRFGEALDVVRQQCPLPGICGRVCHHPCEDACMRGEFDDPIAIRALKRFVADMGREMRSTPFPKVNSEKGRVAVVGSGPAGLTAAYDLARAGHSVTVFEAESDPGGMLRYGIAPYRLPRDVLDAEINDLLRVGIEIRTGCRLGGDLRFRELLENGYQSVLLAVGAQIGRSLRLPGESECPAVEDALAFLRRVNRGARPAPGRRVLVVGGGSTAIEAARTALRLGSETVQILYRRSREEMPAAAEEIEAAHAEGIALRFLMLPTRIVSTERRLLGLQCVKARLGEPDASGRRRPIAIPGSELLIEGDRVLAAIGQESDLGFLTSDESSPMTRHGFLQADSRTLMTPTPGVFAAGDVVTGPATVIEAIAAGHHAARSVRRYLKAGRIDGWQGSAEPDAAVEYELADAPPAPARRIHPANFPIETGREFDEVERAFSETQAVDEAQRCLRCGPCGDCRICASSCRRRHVALRFRDDGSGRKGSTAFIRASKDLWVKLGADCPTSGRLIPPLEDQPPAVAGIKRDEFVDVWPGRVYVREQLCRGCGNCVAVCPFDAIHLGEGNGSAPSAHLESTSCRGCNLCTSVCPTKAVVSGPLSPDWWVSRLHEVARIVHTPNWPALPCVVLACERRAGAMESILDQPRLHAPIIRFRCVGQMDVGMVLELYRRGVRQIIVAGCAEARCRFGSGSAMARERVDLSRALFRMVGADEQSILCDFSERRSQDSLAAVVRRAVNGDPSENKSGVPSTT